MSILTRVNNDVSREEGTIVIKNDIIDAKMTPQQLSTLRKHLIFKAPKVRTVFLTEKCNNRNRLQFCAVYVYVSKTETFTDEYCSVADLDLLKLKCLCFIIKHSPTAL